MALIECRECGQSVSDEAPTCPNCGVPDPAHREPDTESEQINREEKERERNIVAGCLGFALGPVGLWYKRQWAAGFAWLVAAFVLILASGGWLAPILWIGMGIHAAVADTDVGVVGESSYCRKHGRYNCACGT